jgi:hypothetical protein
MTTETGPRTARPPEGPRILASLGDCISKRRRLRNDEEDIFSDSVSQSIAESWRTGRDKALERQFAAFPPVDAASVA